MAIAFVGAYSSQLGSANSPIATYQFVAPAGTPVGALMLAFVSVTGTTPPQTPDGWTYLASYSQYDYINASVSVFSRVFAAGDTTWPCYMFGQSGYGAVVIGAWTGVALVTGPSVVPLAYQTASEGPLKTGDVIAMVWANALTGQSGAITWLTPVGVSQRAVVPASKASGGDAIHALALADGVSGGNGGTYLGGSSMSQSAVGGQGYLLGTMTALLRASATPNVPVLTSPAPNATMNLTGAPTFTWAYVATRPGNSQTGYAFRRKLISGGSYEWWSGSAWQPTEVFVPNTAGALTFPAQKWSRSTYVWSVSSQDADGTGPYAADQTVSGVGPLAPTISAVYDPVLARTAVTVTRQPDNLLSANTASIEVNASGWAARSNAAVARAAPLNPPFSYDGIAALQVTASAAGDMSVQTDVSALVNPGGTYTAVIHWQQNTAPRTAVLTVLAYNGGPLIAQPAASVLEGGASTGTEVRLTFTVPASATLVLIVPNISGPAAGEVHFLDGVGLYAGAYTGPWSPGGVVTSSTTVTSVAQSANMLDANTASIETDATGWQGNYNSPARAISNDFSLDGGHSLKFSVGIGPDTSAIGTVPRVPVAAGQVYTGLLSLRGVTARSVRADLAWFDVSGNYLGSTTGPVSTEVAGTWTQATVSGTAPAGAVSAQLVANVFAVAGASEFHYLDRAGIFAGVYTGVWSPGGVAPVAVRTMSPAQFLGQSTAVSYDYEATPGVPTTYTAVVNGVAAGNAVVSLPAATALVTAIPSAAAGGGWWLKDPLDPTVNLAINPQGPNVPGSISERAGLFEPLGRKFPVVVSDSMGAEKGSATWRTFTAADYAALKTLIRRQSALLLQSPFGEQWFVRLWGDRQWDLLVSTLAQPVRDHKVTWVEVDRPLVSG